MRRPSRVLVAACLAMALPAVSPAQVIDRVLATVGRRTVTLSDARAALVLGLVSSAPGAETIGPALSELITRELVLADVNRYAAPPPPQAEVDRRVSAVRARFASEAAYREALDTTAMTETRLRNRVRDDLRIEAYVDQRFSAPAQPTDDEIARYYEAHLAEFIVSGRQLSLADARDLARERAVAERRRALVADWVDRLRRRTEVVVVGDPGR